MIKHPVKRWRCTSSNGAKSSIINEQIVVRVYSQIPTSDKTGELKRDRPFEIVKPPSGDYSGVRSETRSRTSVSRTCVPDVESSEPGAGYNRNQTT